MIDTVRKLLTLLDKGQKRSITFLFFISCIGAALEVLGVSMILPLVTTIMNPDIINSSSFISGICQFLGINDYKKFVLACILAMIIVFVLKNSFLVYQVYVQNRFSCDNRLKMQLRIMRIFLNKPYEYYLNVSSGEVLRIIQGDVAQTFLLLSSLISLSSDMVVSLALLVTTIIIDPMMTLLVGVILLGLAIIIITVVKPIMRKAGREYAINQATLNKWFIQAISGIKDTKVSQKELFFANKHREIGKKLVRVEKINAVVTQTPRLLIEMFAVCAMLAAMALQISWGREVQSLIPSLSAFAMAALKLMPCANRIVSAVNTAAYNKPALDNMVTLTGELGDLTIVDGLFEKNYDLVDGRHLSVNDKIEMKEISYNYPNSDKNILDKASLNIPVGKSVGIVGPSGAGKTTTVDILLGLLKPAEGAVFADGIDVSSYYDEWLSIIGYIPQMIFMLDSSIRDNVAFGIPENEINDEKVWNALEEAQLAEYVRSLPEGLDTTIGDRGIRISGGQRQRLGIARALYNDPQILFFDEATSALDNETEAAIMESINSLHGKKTIVIIAHRLQTIAACDIIYKVNKGKIEKERG